MTDKPSRHEQALATLRAGADAKGATEAKGSGAPDKFVGKGATIFIRVHGNPKNAGSKIRALWDRLLGVEPHGLKDVPPIVDSEGKRPTFKSEVPFDKWHRIGYRSHDAQWDVDREIVAIVLADGTQVPKDPNFLLRGRS